MKITKILVLALSLSLFSCSKDDNTTLPENATSVKDSGFKTKGKGLTDDEVKNLQNECYQFSTSNEFLAVRSKAKEFTAKLNFTKPDFSSRENLSKWFDTNVKSTKFASTTEAMNLFDEIATKAVPFLSAHLAFFNALPNANPGQVTIILHPILVPSTPGVATNSCDDDCFDAAASEDNLCFAHYESVMSATDNNNFLTAEQKKFSYSLAEAGLNSGLAASTNNLMGCLGGCN